MKKIFSGALIGLMLLGMVGCDNEEKPTAKPTEEVEVPTSKPSTKPSEDNTKPTLNPTVEPTVEPEPDLGPDEITEFSDGYELEYIDSLVGLTYYRNSAIDDKNKGYSLISGNGVDLDGFQVDMNLGFYTVNGHDNYLDFKFDETALPKGEVKLVASNIALFYKGCKNEEIFNLIKPKNSDLIFASVFTASVNNSEYYLIQPPMDKTFTSELIFKKNDLDLELYSKENLGNYGLSYNRVDLYYKGKTVAYTLDNGKLNTYTYNKSDNTSMRPKLVGGANGVRYEYNECEVASGDYTYEASGKKYKTELVLYINGTRKVVNPGIRVNGITIAPNGKYLYLAGEEIKDKKLSEFTYAKVERDGSVTIDKTINPSLSFKVDENNIYPLGYRDQIYLLTEGFGLYYRDNKLIFNDGEEHHLKGFNVYTDYRTNKAITIGNKALAYSDNEAITYSLNDKKVYKNTLKKMINNEYGIYENNDGDIYFYNEKITDAECFGSIETKEGFFNGRMVKSVVIIGNDNKIIKSINLKGNPPYYNFF